MSGWNVAPMERVDLAMNPSQIEYFIGLYREQEHLWNSRHQYYNIRSARSMALHEIASKMGDGWTAQLVKLKWHDLKSNYMREKRKSRTSNLSGDSSQEFTPTWWLFGLMDGFLGPIYEDKRNNITKHNAVQQATLQTTPMEENEISWTQEEDSKNFIINLNMDKVTYNPSSGDESLARDNSHTMFSIEQNVQPGVATATTTTTTTTTTTSRTTTTTPPPLPLSLPPPQPLSSNHNKSMLPMRRNKLKNINRIEAASLEPITNYTRLLHELQGSITPVIQEDPDDLFTKLIGFELKKIQNDLLKSELKLEIMNLCHKFYVRQREQSLS
ncbi:uncharacterized protein LOC115224414 [Argonauta hians]